MRVGALVKARIDYWVRRVFVWFGGVLFGFWFVCLGFFPQVSGKITTDFYNSRPIQKIVSKEHLCIHFSFSTVML